VLKTCGLSVPRKAELQAQATRTSGSVANSLPGLRGLLLADKTSLAKLYLNTLKVKVGPLGNRHIRKLTFMLDSEEDVDALFEEEEGEGEDWEKTIMWVTPRGPAMAI